MPHLFVNRLRMHDLTGFDPGLRKHFFWETVNAIVYKIGGVIFILGSICLLPRFEAYQGVGAQLFILGSLLYLIVSGHDLMELSQYRKKLGKITREFLLEACAGYCYFAGSLLFVIGRVILFPEIGMTIAGAWMFIVGSCLFVIGATVNVLRIVYDSNKLTMQLMNLTAVTFVAGSLLFLFASIPYLWSVDTGHDLRQLFDFLAWQYIIGSVFFLFGGVINYWRAYIIMHHQLEIMKSKK